MKTTMNQYLKLILISLLIFTFSSCGGSEDEPDPITSYQIINNVGLVDSTTEYLDGTMWEIIVFKYRGDDVAGEDVVDPVHPDGDKSIKFEVDSEITKVKVSFKFLPRESSGYNSSLNYRRYYVSYNFLTQKTNNVITLEETTMLSNSIDKSINVKSVQNGINTSDFSFE